MRKLGYWIPTLTIVSLISVGVFLRNWNSLNEQLGQYDLLVAPESGDNEETRSESRQWTPLKSPDVIPHVDGGAFIHVGKTGGSTLTRYLRNACHSHMPKPCNGVIPPNETLVSRLIRQYYHVPDFFKLDKKVHAFYLWSLRDPFSRTVSGFVYGHPYNAKIHSPDHYKLSWKRKRSGYFDAQCFETLEEWVENIGDEPHDFVYDSLPIHLKRDNCTNFARAMLHSRVKRMHHLFYNYQKLHFLLPVPLDNMTIYATRQEHLLDDFAQINRLLGDDKDDWRQTNSTRVRDVSNVTLPITRDLSALGRKRLCRGLDGEYKIYMELLLNAQNLTPQDVMASLEYSQKQCPELAILKLEQWEERIDEKEHQEKTTTTAGENNDEAVEKY